MARYHVTVGQAVKRGQMIGVVGMSGADAPHLHWGVTLNGKEIDGWPLLDQNEVDDSMTIVTYTPFPDGPRPWTAKGGTTIGYRPDLDAAVDKAEADSAKAASRDVAEAAVDEAIKYGGKP
jgi:murein DD-endopeptidase MepM/ murein hydrolase activator NlpD